MSLYQSSSSTYSFEKRFQSSFAVVESIQRLTASVSVGGYRLNGRGTGMPKPFAGGQTPQAAACGLLSCAARGTVLITSSPRLPPLRLVGSQLLYGGGDGTEVQVRWGERKEALGSHSWGGGTPPVLISTPVLGCGIQTSDWRVDTTSAHANVARQLTGRAGAVTPWVQAVWPLAHALTCRTERLLPRPSPSVQKLPTSTAR